tara:strand:+ start:522 stop:1565 length:1044 start_codon:yes stop_codon:yes gene_type:complete
MKYLKIIFILVFFLKTQNVLSEENIFNVNNIEIIKKTNKSNDDLANQAIKDGFEKLKKKILLSKDQKKLSQLQFAEVKSLVSYYQVITIDKGNILEKKMSYNIFFDKEKIHDLFYKTGISYSDIINSEIYLLPILSQDDQLYVYNKNFFYENWNNIFENDTIEFVLPLENIEIIQNINSNKENLLGLDLRNIFLEYSNANLALVLIQRSNSKNEKVYLKTNILGNDINKNLHIEKSNLSQENLNKKIITEVSEEIINIVKSQNLIDIRTPSFLKAKLIIEKNNNLAELNKRLKRINLIDSIFVQEFNNEYILLKIKYLGKLDKIINQLGKQKIILKLVNDNWTLKII